jgi:hypothetical protein
MLRGMRGRTKAKNCNNRKSPFPENGASGPNEWLEPFSCIPWNEENGFHPGK